MLSLLHAIDMEEHAADARERARHAELARADHRDVPPPLVARGQRWEGGVQIGRQREDRRHDFVRRERVRARELGTEGFDCATDRLGGVLVDLDRATDGDHRRDDSVRYSSTGMIGAGMIGLLHPGDEHELEEFLCKHAASSMFLRSNVRNAGLTDHSERHQATYAASFVDGRIVAVAAHAWNGMLLLQAPRELVAVSRLAVRVSSREVRGLAGPWTQVMAARAALGLEDTTATLESNEDLFELDLAAMIVPSDARCVRRATVDDLATLAEFRHDYMVEALHATPGEDLRHSAHGEMARAIAEATAFVLERDGEVVSYSGFNAQLPDVVQIGGVFTPRVHRKRGLARATVAGSLLHARERGAARAILFTDRHNAAARSAYVALGFRVIGDYGLIMLEPPR